MKLSEGEQMVIREFCVENFTFIPQALEAGVERIELCDNLAVGGTTPSYGAIKKAAEYVAGTDTTLAVMIRPRRGNFIYSDVELEMMKIDIEKAIEAGADNLVFGLLTETAKVDKKAMDLLMPATHGLPVTFHMAFDEILDQKRAIDELVDYEVDKILTHGGPDNQPLATEKIKKMMDYAAERIQIMIGGGVTADNLEKMVLKTGVKYVHGTRIINF